MEVSAKSDQRFQMRSVRIFSTIYMWPTFKVYFWFLSFGDHCSKVSSKSNQRFLSSCFKIALYNCIWHHVVRSRSYHYDQVSSKPDHWFQKIEIEKSKHDCLRTTDNARRKATDKSRLEKVAWKIFRRH